MCWKEERLTASKITLLHRKCACGCACGRVGGWASCLHRRRKYFKIAAKRNLKSATKGFRFSVSWKLLYFCRRRSAVVLGKGVLSITTFHELIFGGSSWAFIQVSSFHLRLKCRYVLISVVYTEWLESPYHYHQEWLQSIWSRETSISLFSCIFPLLFCDSYLVHPSRLWTQR
jgi:hypothetical protein